MPPSEQGDDLAEQAHSACVAPTWPEWAVTEDGELLWVRLDLAHRCDEIAAPALVEPEMRLRSRGTTAMWLDREQTEWADDWLLRPVDQDADEAVLYAEYEIEIEEVARA